MMGDLADQRLIAHLLTKAADHGRDLCVEQRLGEDFGIDEENLKILPRGVEYLDHGSVSEKLVKRLKRDAVGQGVNQHSVGIFRAGHGQLHKAKF